MRTILALFAEAHGRGHLAVFHDFAAGLARVIARRRGEARVRIVNG